VSETSDHTEPRPIEIDLRDPALAGFLAWIVPGLGHLYQRRTAKGILFMTSILGTFLFGLLIGDGRVVYAQWDDLKGGGGYRWQYFCQLPAGLPALPALVQSARGQARFGQWYAAPTDEELNQWQYELNHRLELGTVYTMIAGLLNILAIYDACCGPVFIDTGRRKKKRATDQPDASREDKRVGDDSAAAPAAG